MNSLSLSAELRPAASSAPTSSQTSPAGTDATNSGATDSTTGGFSSVLEQLQTSSSGKKPPTLDGNPLPVDTSISEQPTASNGQALRIIALPDGTLPVAIDPDSINTPTAPATEQTNPAEAAFPAASDLLQQIRQAFQSHKNAPAATEDSDTTEPDTDETSNTNPLALAMMPVSLAAPPRPATPTENLNDSLPDSTISSATGSALSSVSQPADGTTDTSSNLPTLDNPADSSTLNPDSISASEVDQLQENGSLNRTDSTQNRTGHLAFSSVLANNTPTTSPATAASQTDALLQNPNDNRLPLDNDPEAWGQQLSSRILTMVGKDIQEARIHLDPPELGALEIRLSVDSQDQTKIQIHAQHPQVREALESQSQRLRDALAQQGLSLNEFNVSDQSQQQTGTRSGQQGNNPQTDNNSLNGSNDNDQTTDLDTPRIQQHQGLLSTYA